VTDELLGWFAVYGVPALFIILAIGAVGLPVPRVLLLTAAGSFVAQGQLSLWQVLFFASAGAVLGDQKGYLIGGWGGRRLADKITDRTGGKRYMDRAHQMAERWGGLAVFMSRWLLTPLGPWINLSSGITDYSWPHFFLWCALGEGLWVVIYVMIGIYFSEYVQALGDLLATFSLVLVGVFVAVVLGWKVFQFFKSANGQSPVNQSS